MYVEENINHVMSALCHLIHLDTNTRPACLNLTIGMLLLIGLLTAPNISSMTTFESGLRHARKFPVTGNFP